jgi:hypothetical protein
VRLQLLLVTEPSDRLWLVLSWRVSSSSSAGSSSAGSTIRVGMLASSQGVFQYVPAVCLPAVCLPTLCVPCRPFDCHASSILVQLTATKQWHSCNVLGKWLTKLGASRRLIFRPLWLLLLLPQGGAAAGAAGCQHLRLALSR